MRTSLLFPHDLSLREDGPHIVSSPPVTAPSSSSDRKRAEPTLARRICSPAWATVGPEIRSPEAAIRKAVSKTTCFMFPHPPYFSFRPREGLILSTNKQVPGQSPDEQQIHIYQLLKMERPRFILSNCKHRILSFIANLANIFINQRDRGVNYSRQFREVLSSLFRLLSVFPLPAPRFAYQCATKNYGHVLLCKLR